MTFWWNSETSIGSKSQNVTTSLTWAELVESCDLSSADLSPQTGRRAEPSLKCGGEMSGNGGAFSLSCLCCSMAAANYREHSEAQPRATKQTETKLIPSRDIRLARESPFCNADRAWIRAAPSCSRTTRTRRVSLGRLRAQGHLGRYTLIFTVTKGYCQRTLRVFASFSW